MEEQPSFEPEPRPTAQQRGVKGLVKRLGRLVFYGLAGTALYALVLGPRNLAGLANGAFIAGAVLLIVALFPLVGEVLGRATVSFGQEDRGAQEVFQDERIRGQQGDALTYSFGLAGMLMVLISLIFDFLSR